MISENASFCDGNFTVDCAFFAQTIENTAFMKKKNIPETAVIQQESLDSGKTGLRLGIGGLFYTLKQ